MSGKMIHHKTELVQTGDGDRYLQLESLVKKAARGDRAALSSLCEKLVRSILYRTKQMLGNEMDAEDATQNILFRVSENIKNLREPKAFSAWLGSIVLNETKRYAGKYAKDGDILDVADHMTEIVEVDSNMLPRESLIEEADHKAMMDIVSNLPARQREAVLLHYYENLSVEEVAKVMELPHQCVSKYLALAREKLKVEIESQQYAWF